jgi:outer membrane protein assembly complex protein YaeT
VVVLLGLLDAVHAGPAATQQLVRAEVTEVRFEGNATFPSDSLSRAIVTRATECRYAIYLPFCWAGADFALQHAYLPRREFPLDQIRLERWYFIRGYREAAIDTSTVRGPDGTTTVTFHVDEGRPVLVDSIEFFGTEDFDAGLTQGLPIRQGVPYNALVVDAARDTLTRRLANRGYAHAEVLLSSFIPTGSFAARVTYDVAPGPHSRYGHITIEGNEHLSESTVLRTLQFRAGDVYRLDQLREAQARLFGLEILRSASIAPDYGSAQDSIVPVTVSLQEGDLHRVRAGTGWSSNECLDVESRWVSRDFVGGGRTLQVRGRVSNMLAQEFQGLLCDPGTRDTRFFQPNWLVSADFSQPWIFSTRNSFQASLYAERQSLPDAFVRTAVGLQLALTRHIGPRTPLTLSYRPERSRLDAAEPLVCSTFLVCTRDDIAELQSAQWLAPVALTFTRSTTDNLLNPSRGYQLLIDLEHAETFTGSKFSYSRVVSEGSRYTRLTGGSILAGRLRVGWVGAGGFDGLLGEESTADIVHPQKRFYAGGASSVRGFPQSRLGPRVLLVRSVSTLLDSAVTGDGTGVCTPTEVATLTCDATELPTDRFTPRATGGTRVLEGNLELRVALGGKVEGALFTDFGQVWDATQSVSFADLEVSPGFGVRYMSPIGPLRLDLAYRFRGGEDLAVVTDQIRPYQPGIDDADDRLSWNGQAQPWVTSGALAVLGPRVLYGESGWLSPSRLQLHLSIGQAF